MQFCFIQGDTVLTMPVTPEGYEFTVGRKIETINISSLGDVHRPGGFRRWTKTFTFLLPAQEYSFMEPGTRADPQYYFNWLYSWERYKQKVRLIITEIDINISVYIQEVTAREQDGSGDMYVDVTVWEYVNPITVSLYANTQGAPRADAGTPEQEQSYTIQKGDTLSMICRRFYGNSGAKHYNALAAYNGIKNPHLIYANRMIKIPPETVLFGGGK